MLDYFKLKERNTTLKTEVIAGITTFMTMAYIIFVNPAILHAGGETGIPMEGAVIATCLGAGLMSILMGVITNTPFALASGMGINAVVVFTIIFGLGFTWQQAMGIIVIEGILVTIMVLTGLRSMIMRAIPMDLKYAIGVGIGLFIAFIGAQEAGFVGLSSSTAVTLGDFTANYTQLAAFGLILTSILVAFRIRGGILLGIIGTAIVGMIFRVIPIPTEFMSIPTKESFSTFFKADLVGAVWSNGMVNIAAIVMIFALFMTDFFDTMGTVIGVGGEAGLLDEEGNLPNLKKVLLIDSLAAVVGGLFGASSITTYIESASGVSDGGRTGIMPTVTGFLFLISIFFAPLIAVIGGGIQVAEGVTKYPVTSPALIIVGFLMMSVMSKIDFKDYEVGIPAFLTIIIMPFTYSISYGIGFGFISYTLIKLFRGKFKELHPLMIIVSILFALAFIAEAMAKKFVG
ncbi:MAG: NCS2 family permease [Candidatus Humimicrobiaceae bacterium]|jgi:AGZA family xanthine/uracil permease-like MFS transporter|nr:NCS2 family permease [Candidatus Humimicrobiaceae bacterium]